MTIEIARGANFIYVEEYIKTTYGDDTWRQILEKLPEETCRFWQGVILATGVYPFTCFKAFAQTLEQELNSPGVKELAQLYEFIASKSLTTMHKIFFKFMSPASVIKNYPKLWKRFFTVGTVTVPEVGNSHAQLLFELPEIFLDWIEPACFGYSKKAVAMAGGKLFDQNITKTEQVASDLYHISFDLRWQE